MFLSKLLVRIRGELLNLKEELAGKKAPFDKAENLLESSPTEAKDHPLPTENSPEKIRDLNREFDELLKDRKQNQSTADKPPGNPRTLG